QQGGGSPRPRWPASHPGHSEIPPTSTGGPSKSRPELVARIRAKGLTQQEIADTAGVAESTVRNDLNRNFADEPPEPITNSRGQQRPAPAPNFYRRPNLPAGCPVLDTLRDFPHSTAPEQAVFPRAPASPRTPLLL